MRLYYHCPNYHIMALQSPSLSSILSCHPQLLWTTITSNKSLKLSAIPLLYYGHVDLIMMRYNRLTIAGGNCCVNVCLGAAPGEIGLATLEK